MVNEPVNEQIISVIYKKITNQSLDHYEERTLKRWNRSSVYNRSLLEDLQTDETLKSTLLAAYPDKTTFWKIIIAYRAALHNGMPRRRGNFWQRIFSWR